MYKENGNTIEFDSLFSTAKYIRNTNRQPNAGRRSLDGASSWHRGQSYDDMMQLIFERGGYWEEGAKSLVEAKSETDAELERVESETFKRDYAGSRPSVPAYLAGSPRSMIRPAKIEQFKPTVKVLVNMTVSHNVDQNQVVNRGAAILTAITAMEKRGLQVHIDCCLTVKCANLTRTYLINLKKAHEAVCIGDVSFSLVHPNMTRRLMLALMERDDKKSVINATRDVYGHPTSPKHDEYNVYLTQMNYNSEQYETPANAFLTVMDKFESNLPTKEEAA